MKLRIQGFILWTGLIISNSNVAQTQVVLEQIQSYSTVLPNASYWKLDQKNALQLRDALERGLAIGSLTQPLIQKQEKVFIRWLKN